MSVTRTALSRLAREQSGFTLIEALMAIITSIVVVGALFAILEISLTQYSRVTDRVQASQVGRLAMTKIVEELHSACIAQNFAPMKEKSTSTELRFVSGPSEYAVIKPREVFEHAITLDEKHRLLDIYYRAAGSYPTFTYERAKKASEVVLAENVYAPAKGSLFTYYKYGTKAGTANGYTSTLEETKAPGTAAEAESVAAVNVAFQAYPSNNYSAGKRPVEFSNQVIFAFGTPDSLSTISARPCE